MLQDIRKNAQGTIAKIIVGLIVISFSIFGIESILVGGGGNAVAQVNGEDITGQELQQSVDTQKRRLIAMMGENLNPALLDDDRLAAQALESLVGRKLLMQSAQGMDLAVSENEVVTLVRGMEQFQVDGAYSPERYKDALSNAGFTPTSFRKLLREDMALNQLRSGLAGSEFATPAELTLNARVLSEQRDLRYLTIPQDKFVSTDSVSDDQVEAFYAANQTDFRSDESVDLDYIELSLEDFFQPVDEAALLEAYELASQDFQFRTRNRVSHILFESDGNASIEERIQAAQAQLNAGVEFTEVAREFSDDIGSAAKGGDLGLSNGDAFPPEMELAIAQLEPGTVSGPVQTEAGIHLILVTERTAGEPPSLEEMRPELEEGIQGAEARAEMLRIVESLRDLSFTADGLDSPATELELSIERVETVTRSHGEGLFANAALLEAAFSEDVLEAGHNSEVIELANNTFVVLRVRHHSPSEVQPLEIVRADIESVISDDNTRVALEAEAQRALAQLRAGSTLEQLASTEGYEWQVELGVERRNNSVPSNVLRRAFELPVPGDTGISTDFVMTGAGDAVVLELVRVSAGDYASLAEMQQRQIEQQVSGEFGNLIDSEFERGLRQDADITVL